MTASFTVSVPTAQREITSLCSIGRAYDEELPDRSRLIFANRSALWDTGATDSVISLQLVEQLKLRPITRSFVHTLIGEGERVVFSVDLMFPNGVFFPRQRVTGMHLETGYDAVIGMDIIGKGDFALTTRNTLTTFSFRHPSIARIDFRQVSRRR